MGLADLMPGISGGTVALLVGIYDRLVSAIANIDLITLKLIWNGRIKDAWYRTDAFFLLILLTGILSSVGIFANGIQWLLTNHPLTLWAFFFGLVLASTVAFINTLKSAPLLYSFGLSLFGLSLALWISLVPRGQIEPSLAAFFLAGSVAVCAMVLPGISGSFILLLLGMYQPVIAALTTWDLKPLVLFVAGCALGLVFFSKILAKLLSNYRELTLRFLSGMLVGSLVTLWPWQNTLSVGIGREGESRAIRRVPVSPSEFADISGDPLILQCLIAAGFGILTVTLFFYVSRLGERKT